MNGLFRSGDDETPGGGFRMEQELKVLCRLDYHETGREQPAGSVCHVA